MTRVVVTGGSGKLGRAVVADLVHGGHEVFNLDRVPSPDPRSPYVKVDFTDYGQVAAARAAKIKTIVWASSETVLGLPFGPDAPPPYIPVDEEYHPRPNSAYSLSKTLEEEMAGQFCRWDPELSMTGLRFSNVMEPADYARFPSFDADPALRQWNLWGYIDARDGAQAVRLALQASRPGMDVFVIAAADTVMSRSSAELAAAVFPDVRVTREPGTHETLLGIDKARNVLGFDPKFSW